ncbi:MAG: putative quinol monooxygenase [Hyphomonadaceae bacterium]
MAVTGPDVKRAKRAAPRTGSSVCVLLRAEAKPGAQQELLALWSDFAFQVTEDEPTCMSYVLTHELGSPTHFAAHARFTDIAAFERHAEAPHLARALRRLSALLATPITIELFLEA